MNEIPREDPRLESEAAPPEPVRGPEPADVPPPAETPAVAPEPAEPRSAAETRAPEPAPEPVRETARSPEPEAPAPSPAPAPSVSPRRGWIEALAERPELAVEVPRRRLAAQSRRDFMLFAAGLLASAAGAWWLLPDRTRARLLPGAGHDRLDTLAARVGLSRENRERVLDRALTFDDDVAEALYSKRRRG